MLNSSGFLQNLGLGFGVIMDPANLLYCFVGCVVGTMVGVLPGIGPLAALSLLLPLTFKIPSIASIIMLTGIFYGAMYGGSTTSILVSIPGESASVVTCIDGHQMAKQGRAGPALGIAAIGSFVAGTFSVVLLSLFSPMLVKVAIKFGPPEYFAVMTLGIVVSIYMVGGSIFKAILMILLGILLACVGMDVISGKERFTFGSLDLIDGFHLVPVLMGMFGLSEILINTEQSITRKVFEGKIRNLWPTIKDLVTSSLSIVRGSVLGFAIGVLPGGSPIPASFLSYAIERKLYRHPEKFGTGIIQGVAGPESANNSAVAASMVPLLSLGIPGNPVTALLLGALIIHGVQPGPMLISQHPDLFWGVIASMYIGNVMLLVLNLPLIGIWVQFIKIPYRVLLPVIFLLCVIGSYAGNMRMFDVWVMIAFGILGFFLRKMNYELAPFALAFVLGPMLEQALRQSLIIARGNPMGLFLRPISGSILGVSVILLILFVLGAVKQNRGSMQKLETNQS